MTRDIGKPWECPHCKECKCCNGGTGNAYTSSYANRFRHWHQSKNRCKHAPAKKRENYRQLKSTDDHSEEEQEESEVSGDDPQNDPKTSDLSDDTANVNQHVPRDDLEISESKRIASHRNLYWDKLQVAGTATRKQLKQLTSQYPASQQTSQSVRISHDIHTVAQDFEQSRPVKPMLLEEYLDLQRQGANPDAEPGFLFLSAEQAREYFASGRPRLPVIVPGELDRDARPLIKRKDVLAKIRAFATVNAHDHLAKVADDLYATEMDTGLVVDSFEKKRGTLNLLDMAIAVPNTTPSFLVDLPGWDLMPYIGSTNELKQPHQHDHRDMSASVNFQLFANLHATSTKHCDRGGVVTTVRAEFGDKMWLTWPSQSVQQLRSFGWSGKPAGVPFPIYIAAGYTLVQPAGTVHEVYTGPLCSDSYMVGTMHTPSQNLDRQAECMEVEAWAVNMTTNEDPAYEAAAKMDAWLEMMKAGNDAFPWPSAEQRAVFEQSFNVSDVSMHATTTLTLVT